MSVFYCIFTLDFIEGQLLPKHEKPIIFITHFCTYVSNLAGRIALIGDNLGSHCSPAVIASTLEHYIKFITLQHIFVSHWMLLCFALWRKILVNWRKVSRYSSCIPKEQTPSLLPLFCEKLEPNHLKSGFSKVLTFQHIFGNTILSQSINNATCFCLNQEKTGLKIPFLEHDWCYQQTFLYNLRRTERFPQFLQASIFQQSCLKLLCSIYCLFEN